MENDGVYLEVMRSHAFVFSGKDDPLEFEKQTVHVPHTEGDAKAKRDQKNIGHNPPA
jgi:hypothetical protein